MRLIIEARVEGEQTSATAVGAVVVAVVEPQDHSVSELGLTFAEGPALLADVQSTLVAHQVAADNGRGSLLPMRLGAGAQGQPIDRDADCVWQGRGAGPCGRRTLNIGRRESSSRWCRSAHV